MKDPNTYPKGFNRRKVEAIIAHYESQTENDAVAEDEAAFAESDDCLFIPVPRKLVPKVRRLIREHQAGAA